MTTLEISQSLDVLIIKYTKSKDQSEREKLNQQIQVVREKLHKSMKG